MRHIFYLIITILLYGNAYSQVKTISITEFGAKPNDSRSDQAAFNDASDYINAKKGNVKLVFPAGKYLVGPEYQYNTSIQNLPTGKLWDVFNILNCKNVFFEGKGAVIIKFFDNIPFGCTQPFKDNRDSSVHIGSLFRFTNSSEISIFNIQADGNNQKFRLLRNWGMGANPYEREHEGLFILNCQNVTVKNSSFNFFGRDGAMFLQDSDKMAIKNLDFINCKFNNNGRDGVSLCGGSNVNFYNCTFSFNASGKIVTNPASGIDIEPERDAECKTGKFLKCTFAGNGGYGVISMYEKAFNFVFDSCTITGNTNYSMVINSPQFTFTNSSISGTALLIYDANKESDGLKINNCYFMDSLIHSKVFRSNYMVSVQGRYIRFKDCNFISYKIPSIYTEIRKKKGLEDSENTILKNCLFDARFKKKSTWGNWPFLVSHSLFIDCTFKSAGYADFNGILWQTEKNIHQKNNKLIN